MASPILSSARSGDSVPEHIVATRNGRFIAVKKFSMPGTRLTRSANIPPISAITGKCSASCVLGLPLAPLSLSPLLRGEPPGDLLKMKQEVKKYSSVIHVYARFQRARSASTSREARVCRRRRSSGGKRVAGTRGRPDRDSPFLSSAPSCSRAQRR